MKYRVRNEIIHSLQWITIYFQSLVRRFGNDFHSGLRHSWKSLPNRLTRDQKNVIHGNSYIILYIYPWNKFEIYRWSDRETMLCCCLTVHHLYCSRREQIAVLLPMSWTRIKHINTSVPQNSYWALLNRFCWPFRKINTYSDIAQQKSVDISITIIPLRNSLELMTLRYFPRRVVLFFIY